MPTYLRDAARAAAVGRINRISDVCIPNVRLCFLQIRVDGSSLALQYETVQAVENGPILRDMAFSSDYHYLYVMSETQVSCTQTHTSDVSSTPTPPLPLSQYHNHWHLSFCYVTGENNLWCSMEDFIIAWLEERKGLDGLLDATTVHFCRHRG